MLNTILTYLSSHYGLLGATGLHTLLVKKYKMDRGEKFALIDIVITVAISLLFGIILPLIVAGYYGYIDKAPVLLVIEASAVLGSLMGYTGIRWLGSTITEFKTKKIDTMGEKPRRRNNDR